MREITAEEYTRFSSNESCHVGLSELEAMSLLAGPRLRARDGQTGSKCVGPGRLDQKLRTYDSLFPALMHGNLIVVTYPGCGYCFAGSPTRIPTARNIEGAPVPNRDDEHLGARILTKFLTQTTRRVHRLAAILLRRWQAEEIAKTPFPCVSRIWTNDHVWRSIGHATCLSARFRLPCAPAELTSGTSGGRR